MRPTQRSYRFSLPSYCLLLFLFFMLATPPSWAQRETSKPAQANSTAPGQSKPSRPRRPTTTGRTAAPARNAQISRIVSEIDARNIENTIRKLVSFGTRNTLSDQNDPNRGIGAARDWLYSEFQKAAAESDGRMVVEKQTFEQPKAARVPQPTMLTNIVATLKGLSRNRPVESMLSAVTTIRCVPVQPMPSATHPEPTMTRRVRPRFWRWRG